MHPLEQKLAYQFQQPKLLQLALTHPSMVEMPADNQRLEFLGDAVLDLIIAEALFLRFPEKQEGCLTPMKAQMVSGSNLAQLAASLDLGSYLVMSSGEEGTGGRAKEGALADAFEALCGALFLDSDLATTKQYFLPFFEESFANPSLGETNFNPKGKLQEVLQAICEGTPEYLLTEQQGPDHQPLFVVEVYWRKKYLGKGTGKSKKAAQFEAAKDALTQCLWEKNAQES